jgi:DNA-binding MarR family transcriptional regulator
VSLRVAAEEDVSPPPPLIGALLRVPWEVVRERMLSGLHARGFTDLTAAHLNVLQHPGPDRVRPSDLAARTGMSRLALNYLLGQMEHGGYLQRRDDPGDQRSKRIHLTKRGDRAVKAIREILVDVETDWEHELGARQFSELRELLTRLYSAVAPALAGGGTGD